MSNKKYLIFLDIDETVMTHETIHPRTTEALRRAKEEGHKIFINTGRAYSIVPEKVVRATDPDGYVCGIGMTVIIDGRIEFSKKMDYALVERLMDFAKRHSILATVQGENSSVSYGGRFFSNEDSVVSSFEDMRARFPDMNATKMSFRRRLTDEEVNEISDAVAVYNYKNYAEVNLYGYTKASGMRIVQRALGVSDDRVIAIGDSLNDAEMLKAAGIAVVMGNADDEIKELADFVTLPCCDGGVGYAIEKLVLEEK